MKKITPVLKTEADYRKLVAELEAVEAAQIAFASSVEVYRGRLYLTDENVDAENVMDGGECAKDSAEFWHAMYAAAVSAAGFRAEQYGFDLNEAIGYRVY